MMRKSPIKTLNVDPGLTTLGWSMIEYDLDTNQKTVVKYGVITGKTLLKNQKEMQAKFAKRYIILWELEPILMDLIKEWQPDYVACESAYAHSFIESYAALVMVIQTLRTAVMRTLNQDIYLIAPREGKKAVSQDGTADKSSVQTAIFANPTITIRSSKHNPLDAISEHECDSIAVGVAFIQNQLPSILASKQVTV
jgi:Holliday junction resolvasome RuvABC endonuclease subunit